MKLFGRTKKVVDKIKIAEKIPCLEAVQVALLYRDLVDNQYQQKSKVLYTFTQINIILVC